MPEHTSHCLVVSSVCLLHQQVGGMAHVFPTALAPLGDCDLQKNVEDASGPGWVGAAAANQQVVDGGLHCRQVDVVDAVAVYHLQQQPGFGAALGRVRSQNCPGKCALWRKIEERREAPIEDD